MATSAERFSRPLQYICEIDETENQKPNGPLASYNSATATLYTLMYSSTTSLASALTHRRVRAERGSKNMKTKKSKCISPWQWRNHKNTCSHLESNWIRRPAPSQNKIIQTKNLYTRKSWAAKTWKPCSYRFVSLIAQWKKCSGGGGYERASLFVRHLQR